MTLTPVPLRMYARETELAPIEWSWVEEQLVAAGTYWVTPRSKDHPHPRPVWGSWADDALFLSIGSHVVARELRDDPVVAVHLDSGTDVVIVEGRALPNWEPRDLDALITAYNAKYDWDYKIEDLGPLTQIHPEQVIAWRSAGWAGREGFRQSGKWRAGDPDVRSNG